jgi:hypothetical protein
MMPHLFTVLIELPHPDDMVNLASEHIIVGDDKRAWTE